jgi:eukaryotic translation initiation factor 2C
MDLLGCRYAAAVESNGHRVEIISKANMERMLKPLFREWMQTVGGGCFPSQIIYFRDGVSEGQ